MFPPPKIAQTETSMTRKFIALLFAVVGAVALQAEDAQGRWGVGGALGVGDFLSPSHVNDHNKAFLYSGVSFRRGFSEKGEVLVAFDSVQGKSQSPYSRSVLQPLTVSWYQGFGSDVWNPFFTVGVGPGFTSRVSVAEKNHTVVTLRSSVGVERFLREDFSVGVGAVYHYGFKDGQYTPSVSALMTFLSVQWFYRCGGVRPIREMKTETVAPAPKPEVILDADGDTVADDRDVCPDTPTGVAVDALGCPLDGDQDGVWDTNDECKATPPGVLVDATGCPVEKVSVTLNVLFSSGKSVVQPEFESQIKKAADFMVKFPGTTVVIEGHSDNVGSAALNKRLSQARADAVRNFMIYKFQVDPLRVTAIGFGPDQPIETNDTPEGRSANRRVMATISAEKTSKGE